MTANAFHNISQIESSLWEAADQLRANSKLTSSEYCMPVLGVIFLVKGDFIKRRAGFVMSSQASSAGHGEKEVRRKLVQTGDVDVMVAIRSNFFYTRTVPCELWHFDRAKPAERKDKVLMLDARAIYRKVTRKIYDFSPEQQANLAAIVWLYRGQRDRFLGLVRGYIGRVCEESAAVDGVLSRFEILVADAHAPLAAFGKAVLGIDAVLAAPKQALNDPLIELTDARHAYMTDRAALVNGRVGFNGKFSAALPESNDAQHQARQVFDPLADAARGLIKQVDLLYKLAARAAQLAQEMATNPAAAEFLDRRAVNKLVKQLDEERKAAVEPLKAVTYLHRQVAWLQDRFPKAEMQDVLGLCKVVTRAEIEAADWSLTPGRFVGVAPAEVDEDLEDLGV